MNSDTRNKYSYFNPPAHDMTGEVWSMDLSGRPQRLAAPGYLEDLAAYATKDQYADSLDRSNKAFGLDIYGENDRDERDYQFGFAVLRATCGDNSMATPEAYWIRRGEEVPQVERRDQLYNKITEHFSTAAYDVKKKKEDAQREIKQNQEKLIEYVRDFVGNQNRTTIDADPQAYLLMERAGLTESVYRAKRAAKEFSGIDLRNIDILQTDAHKTALIKEALQGDNVAKEMFLEYVSSRMENKDDERRAFGVVGDIATLSEKIAFGVRDNLYKGVNAVVDPFFDTGNDNETAAFLSEIKSAVQAGRDSSVDKQGWARRAYLGATDMAGSSVSLFVPGGFAAMVASGADDERIRALSEGMGYWQSFTRGSGYGYISARVEKLAFGKLGKGMVSTFGAEKLLKGAAYAKGVSWLSKSATARAAGAFGLGVVEEGLLEPAAEGAMKFVYDHAMNGLGVYDARRNMSFGEWGESISQNWQGDDLAALMCFSAGMTAANIPYFRQAASNYSESLTNYKAIGGRETDFVQALSIENDAERDKYLIEQVGKAWESDPQAALARMKGHGGQAAINEQMNALREMEGFAALQQGGILPQFEWDNAQQKFSVERMRETETSAEEQNAEADGKPKNAVMMTGEELNGYLGSIMNAYRQDNVLNAQDILATRGALEGLSKRAGIKLEEMDDTASLRTLRHLSRQAFEGIEARIDQGMSRAMAEASTDEALSPNIPLGTLSTLAGSFEQRLQTADGRGERSRQETNAYRVSTPYGTVIRYVKGKASVFDVWEEVMEEAADNYMRGTGMDESAVGAMLRTMQTAISLASPKSERFIREDGDISRGDIIEAFSSLGKSRIMTDYKQSSLPSWIKKFLDFIARFMPKFNARIQLGEALKAMDSAGKIDKPIRDILETMTGSVTELYRDAAAISAEELYQEWQDEAELNRHREELYAMGNTATMAEIEESLRNHLAAQKSVDEAQAADDKAHEEEMAEAYGSEAENPTPEQIEKSAADAAANRDSFVVEQEGQPDASGVFTGNFLQGNGFTYGFIAMDKLSLSNDIPQFKRGADGKGVVRKIRGAWRYDCPPIYVWQRETGKLEVISGRHRFARAQELGLESIQCIVYRENAEHGAAWAKTLDIEDNIRNNNATPLEIAYYVRTLGLSREECIERGLMRDGTPRQGCELAFYASPAVMDALERNAIDDRDAYRIACLYASNEAVQRVGVSVMMDGGSWAAAANAMHAKAAILEDEASSAVSGSQGLFGFIDEIDTDAFAREAGQYAARKTADISAEIRAINGASAKPELAKKYGIDVNDPKSIRETVSRLQEEKRQWEKYYLHPELRNEAFAHAKNALGIQDAARPERAASISFSVVSQDANGRVLSSDTFVTKSDGSPDWFMIPKRKGQAALPVRLLIGDDRGEHSGYGLNHIVASRGKSFWEGKSPKKFIQSTLSGASELYEIVPGREILVRGKNPSSWMILQLSKQDGYYSIVTAFPAPQKKKPLGKKIPFAEREYAERQEPANPESGTGGLGRGSAAVAALPSQFAGGEDGSTLSDGVRFVNMEDVTCRFDDGSEIKASFSLAATSAAWKKTLHGYLNGGDTKRDRDLVVCPTPSALQMLGARPRDLVITPGVIEKVTRGKHSVPVSELERLPEALHAPIAVFESTQYDDTMVVLTVLQERGKNVVVAVQLEGNATDSPHKVRINRILSLYGKDSLKGIVQAPCLYVDYTQFRPLDPFRTLQLRGQVSGGRNSHSILTPKDLVKWKQSRGLPDTSFSIIGENAATWKDHQDTSYTDPADGKRKAVLDTRGIVLKKKYLSVPKNGHKKVTLQSLIDFPELFAAYPELREYEVELVNDTHLPYAGFADAVEAMIQLNVSRLNKGGAESILRTLMHEVQHIIQTREGFARGAPGFKSAAAAITYIDSAIEQMSDRSNSPAGEERIQRLQKLRKKLSEGKINPLDIYFISHGETEARFAGTHAQPGVSMAGANPTGSFDVPSEITVPVINPQIGFSGIGRNEPVPRFIEASINGLLPSGVYHHDSSIFRMREGLLRLAQKWDTFGSYDNASGTQLMAESMVFVQRAVDYLPKKYRFGTEPYLTWLHIFSHLYETGELDSANLVPMKGWDKIMLNSFYKAFRKHVMNDPGLKARYEAHVAELKKIPRMDETEMSAEEIAMESLFEDFGREFLQDYGGERVDRLVGKLIRRVAKKLEQYAKDQYFAGVTRLLESVAPRLGTNRKPTMGKMDVDAYQRLQTYVELMNVSAHLYKQSIEQYNREREQGGTPDNKLPLLEEMMPNDTVTIKFGGKEVTATVLELRTYGSYERMTLHEAEGMVKALNEYVATQRNIWENVLQDRKDGTAIIAEKIIEQVGAVDEQEMAKLRQKGGKVRKMEGSLIDMMESMPHFLARLEKYPALAPWVRSITSRSAYAMTSMRGERYIRDIEHNALLMRASGKRTVSGIRDWLHEFRKPQDTGITLTEQEKNWMELAREEYRERILGLVKRKVKTYGATAVLKKIHQLRTSTGIKEEIESLYGAEQKDEESKEVFTETERATYGSELEWIKARSKKMRDESDWVAKEKKPREMKLDSISRDAAALLVLYYEQEDYTGMMNEKGYTPSVIRQLREYVGADGMEYAYGLRELLNKRSRDVQETIETRYGVPFPLIDNYFRGIFDVSHETETVGLTEGGYGDMAILGGFGMLAARIKHKADLRLDLGATAVFEQACAEQDVFLHLDPIVRDMRDVIFYKRDGARADNSLKKAIGLHQFARLQEWMKAMDRAGAEYIGGFAKQSAAMSAMNRVAASVLLSGNAVTIMKQVTGLLNAWMGDDSINPLPYLASLGRVLAGGGKMSAKGMWKQDIMQSRRTASVAEMKKSLAARPGEHIGRWDRINQLGMDTIETVDIMTNSVSSAALYDTVWRSIEREERNGAKKSSDAEKHAVCMERVRTAMIRRSQPMNHLEKGYISQKRSILTDNLLFLGGETLSIFGNITRMPWKKKATAWVLYGALIQLVQALADYCLDDEKRRRKRTWWGYFVGALAGPAMGVPFVSSIFAGMARQIGVPIYSADSVTPVTTDVEGIMRDMSGVWKIIKGEEMNGYDEILACLSALKVATMFSGLGSKSSRKWVADGCSAMLSVAALGNVARTGTKAAKAIDTRSEDEE